MALVSKGVVVKVHTAKTYDHSFKAGALATSEGVDFGSHHRGTWSLFRNEEGETQCLLPEHYDLVEAPKAVEKKVVVEAPAVKAPVIVVEEDNAEVATLAEDLPNKVVYGVLNAEDEIYATTADRDFARELKAALGGKRKGVRIFQYAAVKEIR
ncbi:hypothetical protein VCM_00065 [Pseudomonas phage VCM]|uniref:Uncharacterized protein n=1 Tax=Pseudomonas phage VCM TaxID=1729937 RepID=A0A0S4KZ61_9CAUD|nr:hypothetical protein VCM_00065 [Pseudomonas phage VCM]CUR44284.1 hypothetical protein VCM_00065 [Pseudomonas phage VCM]